MSEIVDIIRARMDDCVKHHDVYIHVGLNEMEDILSKLRPEPKNVKTKVRHGAFGRIDFFCPNCVSLLGVRGRYCPNCGQALKYKNEGEKP